MIGLYSNRLGCLGSIVVSYFKDQRITWHRHADHGLSSQVCCLNFLAPLATQPELLARVIGGALEIAPPQMLRVEDGPDGQPQSNAEGDPT